MAWSASGMAAGAVAGTASGSIYGTLIGGALGGFMGADADQSANTAREINRMQLEESQRNRDWQERMSSTAHQREVADLRAAGLNPILSATGGSGASSPGGSMAVLDNPDKNLSQDRAANAMLIANSAKAMSEVRANNESVKTQKTQQVLNASNAKASLLNAQANLQNASTNKSNVNWMGIPGFGRISVRDAWSGLKNTAKKVYNAGKESYKRTFWPELNK